VAESQKSQSASGNASHRWYTEIGASWSVLRFDHSIYQFREPATKLSIKDNFDVRALTHSRIKLVSQ
jgi:hypothetical protein